MTSAENLIDADELLHLAMHASRQGQHEYAMATLKRAIMLEPQDPKLRYALSAQYVQIGFFERAVGQLKETIALDATFDAAHFQLGWIYLNADQEELAKQAWSALDRLGNEHVLYLFKTGLLHLAKQEYVPCEDHLRRGLAANKTHLSLNTDIANILKNVQAHLARTQQATAAEKETPAAPKTKPTTPPATGSVRLGAYQKNQQE